MTFSQEYASVLLALGGGTGLFLLTAILGVLVFRQRRDRLSLTQEGWMGWGSVLSSPRLVRRLSCKPDELSQCLLREVSGVTEAVARHRVLALISRSVGTGGGQRTPRSAAKLPGSEDAPSISQQFIDGFISIALQEPNPAEIHGTELNGLDELLELVGTREEAWSAARRISLNDLCPDLSPPTPVAICDAWDQLDDRASIRAVELLAEKLTPEGSPRTAAPVDAAAFPHIAEITRIYLDWREKVALSGKAEMAARRRESLSRLRESYCHLVNSRIDQCSLVGTADRIWSNDFSEGKVRGRKQAPENGMANTCFEWDTGPSSTHVDGITVLAPVCSPDVPQSEEHEPTWRVHLALAIDESVTPDEASARRTRATIECSHCCPLGARHSEPCFSPRTMRAIEEVCSHLSTDFLDGAIPTRLFLAKYLAALCMRETSSEERRTASLPVLLSLRNNWSEHPGLELAVAVVLADGVGFPGLSCSEIHELILGAYLKWPTIEKLANDVVRHPVGALELRHKALRLLISEATDPQNCAHRLAVALGHGHSLPAEALSCSLLVDEVLRDARLAELWQTEFEEELAAVGSVRKPDCAGSQSVTWSCRWMLASVLQRVSESALTLSPSCLVQHLLSWTSFLVACPLPDWHIQGVSESVHQLLEMIGSAYGTKAPEDDLKIARASAEVWQSLLSAGWLIDEADDLSGTWYAVNWIPAEVMVEETTTQCNREAWAAYCVAGMTHGNIPSECAEAAASSAFQTDVRSKWLVRWLTERLASQATSLTADDLRDLAERVFRSAWEMRVGVGEALGLVRLPEAAEQMTSEQLVSAWEDVDRHIEGDRERIARRFVDGTADREDVFTGPELEIATSARQWVECLPPHFERLLLRTLWLAGDTRDLLFDLVSSRADDTDLLSSLLARGGRPPDSMLCLAAAVELARRNQATLAQDELLTECMADSRFVPVEVAPFRNLIRSPERRQFRGRDVCLLGRCFDSHTICDSGLDDDVLRELSRLRLLHREEYDMSLRVPSIRDLVSARAEIDPVALVAVGDVVIASETWDESSCETLLRAFRGNLLDDDGLAYLNRRLWEDDSQLADALAVAQRLVERRVGLGCVAEALAEASRREAVDPLSIDWLDLHTLLHMRATGTLPQELKCVLVEKLFCLDSADPQEHMRIASSMLSEGAAFPVSVLFRCLQNAQNSRDYSLFLNGILQLAQGGNNEADEALSALQWSLETESTYLDTSLRIRAYRTLFEHNRLQPEQLTGFVVILDDAGRFDCLPPSFLMEYGATIASQPEWPPALGDALCRLSRRQRETAEIDPLLLARLQRSFREALPASHTSGSVPDNLRETDHLQGLEEAALAQRDVPLGGLLEILEARLDEGSEIAGELGEVLCGQVKGKDLAQHCVLDLLCRLEARNMLPESGYQILVPFLCQHSQSQHLAMLSPHNVAAFCPPSVIREVFRLLFPSLSTRKRAQELLCCVLRVSGSESNEYLGEILMVAEAGSGTPPVTHDPRETALLFLDSAAAILIGQQRPEPDHVVQTLRIMLQWPDAHFGFSEKNLLLKAAHTGLPEGPLRSDGQLLQRLVRWAEELERPGRSEQSLEQALVLRRAYSCWTLSERLKRMNEIAIVKRHANHYRPPAQLLIRLLREETADDAPALRDVSASNSILMAALNSLPTRGVWSPDELDLAQAAIECANARREVFRRAGSNLPALIEHVLRESREPTGPEIYLTRIDVFAEALRVFPDQRECQSWLDKLIECLRVLDSLPEADASRPGDGMRVRLRELLAGSNTMALAPHHTSTVLKFALGRERCDITALIVGAQRVGTVDYDTAVELMRRCFADGLRRDGVSILEHFSSAVEIGAPSGNQSRLGFGIAIPRGFTKGDFARLVGALGDSVNRASDADDRPLASSDLRVNLRQVQAEIAEDRLSDATLRALEMHARLAVRDEQVQDDETMEWANSGYHDAFCKAIGELVQVTGEASYLNPPMGTSDGDALGLENVGLQRRLVHVVCMWLDMELSRANDSVPTREEVDEVSEVIRTLGEVPEKRGELPPGAVGGLVERLLREETRSVINTRAIELLEAWCDSRKRGVTLYDRLLLARLLAGNRQITAASQRLIDILASGTFSIDKRRKRSDGEFRSLVDCLVYVLERGFLSARFGERRDRQSVLDFVHRVDDATQGFLTPAIRELAGLERVAYGRLMVWSGLTLVVDLVQQPSSPAHAEERIRACYWINDVLRDPVAAPECHPRFLAPLMAALGAEPPEGDAIRRCLIARDAPHSFEAVRAWFDSGTPTSTPEMGEREGRVLERYRTVRRLSNEERSRLSELLECIDKKTGKRVVVKRLPRSFDDALGGSKNQERVRQEAKIIESLNHPGIIKLAEDIRQTFRTPPYYFVMEFIPGKDLQQWVNGRRRPSWDESMKLFRDLLSAVMALHEAGLVHRNLHPRNVRVIDDWQARRSRVVVTDMSSIKPFRRQAESQTRFLDCHAADYIAKELLEGGMGSPHPAADIFSLGRLLALLFTGSCNPPDTEWPYGLEDLIPIYRKATQYSPALRYGGRNDQETGLSRGIHEMLAAFDQVMAEKRLSTAPYAPSETGTAPGGSLKVLRHTVADLKLFRKTPTSRIVVGVLRENEQRVAVKVIHARSEHGREVWSRIGKARELRMQLSEIKEDGIAAIPRDPLDDGALIYLFSEFVYPGISLAEIYAYADYRGVPIAPALLTRWLCRCLKTLAACHRKGIYHRCLQPSNVLIAQDGTPRVSDFVLSSVLSSRIIRKTRMLSGGTFFSAPASDRGEPSSATDVHSLLLTFTVGMVGEGVSPTLEDHLRRLEDFGRLNKCGFLTDLLSQQIAENVRGSNRRADLGCRLATRLMEAVNGRDLRDEPPTELIERMLSSYVLEPRPLQEEDLL